jgi:biotin operon repressor|tara:strand:- start:330 stop:695 length:366 start_codon:yes stop_codon:yes gene_type:complete
MIKQLPHVLAAYERVKLTKAVMSLLREGKQNAISGNELARRLGQGDDRKIRLVIREIIRDGIPIASSVTPPMGYYIVKNGEESASYIAVLTHRIKEDQSRLDDFKAAVSCFSPPEQLNLIK